MFSSKSSALSSADRRRSQESQPLLPSITQSELDRRSKSIPFFSSLFGFCVRFKATILILLWSIFVGALYLIINTLFHLIIYLWYLVPDILLPNFNYYFVLPYAVVSLFFIFYPLSGYLADVCCGRFKTIMSSLALLLCSFTTCLTSFFILFLSVSITLRLVFITVGISFLFIAAVGIAGYSANIIQFGLDQLLDAPSHHQALFVHWIKWCYDFMSSFIVLLFVVYYVCDVIPLGILPFMAIVLSIFILCELMLLLLLIIGCWKRHWFYTEPAHYNPYKTVIKVLNFARKHKYPVQRSAFTYCDDEKPSRLDFGKERFGGPFTTEQVEDVKTFFRIVTMLLAIGPVFIADEFTSVLFVIFISFHFGSNEDMCTWNSILVNGSVLKFIMSTFFLPIYMWIVFVVLQKRIPKILCRLGFGILLYFLGVVYVFVVDTIGHALYHQEDNTQCIAYFVKNVSVQYYDISSLNMHWAVNIPTNILFGIGPTLVTATVFEFISAQSPHSMKGLLLGTYYAISGVYQIVSSLVVLPLVTTGDDVHYPSRIGCLFGYFLFVSLATAIGVILFTVAATKYKHRERDDRPYDHRFVIDIYNRYLNEASKYESSSSESN